MIIPVGGKESESFQSNLTHANIVKTTLEERLAELKPRIKVCTENKDLREAKAEAIKKKIPYMFFVGVNERMHGNVAVISWDGTKYSPETKHMDIEEIGKELGSKILSKL